MTAEQFEDDPTMTPSGTGWNVFIQWKGTDVCLDFRCPDCGKPGHFHGDFAYALRCGYCGSIFELGTEVTLTKIDEADAVCVQDVPKDEIQ